MPTLLTLPSESQGAYFYSDLDIYQPYSVDNGDGSIYVRNGGLYVQGLSDLNQTTIDTTNGEFSIFGSNRITAAVTSSIELTATANSFFTTTSGTLSLNATSTGASGKINITGSGTGTDTVLISAVNSTSGQVHITSAGAANPSVLVDNTNATGQVLISSAGTGAQTIKLNTNTGGIAAYAVGLIDINTTDTANGIKIATITNTVPVTIGTTGSLTTIQGDLLVKGSTTSVNTITLTFENNVLELNSGNTLSGYDAGIAVRRYQTPNDTPAGNVVLSTPSPVQESGVFQAGSATPGTLVLSPFASATNNWYKGWWIKITSGAGINQVRRIKSYVGATKTVTLYVSADNVTPPPGPTTEVKFSDGLDLTVAPAALDTYRFYDSGHVCTFYDEIAGFWEFYSIADIESGITSTTIQQPQNILSGEIDVKGKTYYNTHGTSVTTTITFQIIGHSLTPLISYVRITDSSAFTPAITSGLYQVMTTPTADTFTITVGSSTTSTVASSATVYFYNSSALKVNTISSFDPEFPIYLPGISVSQQISIPKTSTASFFVTLTSTFGAYLMLVSDISGTGASAVFACASAGNGVTSSRLIGSKGLQNQRISSGWDASNQVTIFQMPAGSGVGNYVYTIRLLSCL